MSFAIQIGGFNATAKALDGIAELAAEKLMVERAGQILHEEVKATISATDHSLADLAKLDHPYARRHGSIRIHRAKPQTVHRQSGAMLSALRARPDRLMLFGSSVGVYRVWFDLAAAPHARYVLQGTRKMLARDVLWDTANDRRVVTKMRKAVIELLGKELRSKARIRFGAFKASGTTRTNT